MDAKQATKLALEYFGQLYGNALDPRLEEVELTDDAQYWLITLSYPDPHQINWDLLQKRDYKVFTIADATGEVKSMKIRKVG